MLLCLGLGVLSVSVHRHGHLHLLCSDALCGGGSARDTVQQHTRRLVVGRGEYEQQLYFTHFQIFIFRPSGAASHN